MVEKVFYQTTPIKNVVGNKATTKKGNKYRVINTEKSGLLAGALMGTAIAGRGYKNDILSLGKTLKENSGIKTALKSKSTWGLIANAAVIIATGAVIGKSLSRDKDARLNALAAEVADSKAQTAK